MRFKFRSNVILIITLIVVLFECQLGESQKTDDVTQKTLEEPTTKKSGFFKGIKTFFSRSSTTENSIDVTTAKNKAAPTFTTTTTSRATVSSLKPNVPSQGFGGPNLPPGSIPYQPKKPQPSGFELSYGAGGGAPPTPPPRGVGVRPQNVGAGGNLAAITPSPATISTSTGLPRTTAINDISSINDPKKIPAGGSPTFATTSKPQPTPQLPKEHFPTLSPPKSPSIKEDFPPLPTPKSPIGNPASPGGNVFTSTPFPIKTPSSSPSAWGNPVPPPSGGVAFIPNIQDGTTTVRPGFPSSIKPLASDDEIREVTENLYTKEINHQINLVQVNLQGKTRSIDSADEAPQPLLQIDEKALETPTIAKMRPLFNNYEMDITTNEYVSPNERKEEEDFLDAIMSTNVMRQTMLFLQNKGIVTPDPKTHRDLVKEIWFTQYSRGNGKIGSSGFEHVFVNEVKNGTIIGLHNWVYFYEQEKDGKLDYKGYLNKADLGNKGMVVKARFTHNGNNKPVNTLFVGTSPELEIALYTLCFELRPDRTCPVSLGGTKFGIVTYSWRYRGKNLIGSAYPEI